MLAKPNVALTPEGNIQLEWHTLNADLIVEIVDGVYDYYFRDDRGEAEWRTKDINTIWEYVQSVFRP